MGPQILNPVQCKVQRMLRPLSLQDNIYPKCSRLNSSSFNEQTLITAGPAASSLETSGLYFIDGLAFA